MKNYTSIDVRPMTGSVGAEIHGIDIAAGLSLQQREEILHAFGQFGVLAVPNQKDVTPEQHFAFGEIFGPLMDLPHIPRVPGHELLHQVRREATDTSKVVGENWHSDSTFLPSPPAAVVMRAIDVPDGAGDTLFSSSYAGYELLSEGMKAMIEPLKVVHSAAKVFGTKSKEMGNNYAHRPGVTEEDGNREVLHPLVCVHPVSGRKHLYLNLSYGQRFEGMTEAESAPLMQYLFQLTTRPDITCRMRWHNNMWVVWDNRATMHRAVFDYPQRYRCLYRTTHSGPVPSGMAV